MRGATRTVPTIDELQQQLWAATAEQRRLQVALDRARDAERQAEVDAFAAEIEQNPNPHALLEWISAHLWETEPGAWIAKPLNEYFLAIAEAPAQTASDTCTDELARYLTKEN